jgi:hypothetical protein
MKSHNREQLLRYNETITLKVSLPSKISSRQKPVTKVKTPFQLGIPNVIGCMVLDHIPHLYGT